MANEVIERLAAHPVMYEGERCVTLDDIDLMHERPVGTAKGAYRRHKGRMEEGKHYHQQPYREWRQEVNGGTLNVPPNRGGHKGPRVLLTERGYLMIVKVFDDDRAWAIQEELIDGYFRVAEANSPSVAEVFRLLMERITLIEERQQRQDDHISQLLAVLTQRPAAASPECPPTGANFVIRDRIREMWPEAKEKYRDRIMGRILGEFQLLGIFTARPSRSCPHLADTVHLPIVDKHITTVRQQYEAEHRSEQQQRRFQFQDCHN